MARVTAPLMSFSARGKLANALVFATWNGRDYVRSWVSPANPNTASQQTVRTSFSFLNRLWPYIPAGARGAWELYALNSAFTSRNGWLKQNQPVIRGDTDLADLIISPAAGGGIVDGGVAFTPASAAIDIVITAPTLPTGWSIVAAHALAVQDVDPYGAVTPDIGYATDAATPFEPDISGLIASTDYVVGAWFEFLKANGDSAYGIATTSQETTLA